MKHHAITAEEFVKICEQTIVAYFKALLLNVNRGTEEKNENPRPGQPIFWPRFELSNS
jgi:hypothetical protein